MTSKGCGQPLTGITVIVAKAVPDKAPLKEMSYFRV
jgi:hypothetical protein